jgi:hypothetical protein
VCILVGCKMEEEPRRIRDVVNLSRLLGLPSWEDNNDRTDNNRKDGEGKCVDAGDMTGKDEPRLAGIDDSRRRGGVRKEQRWPRGTMIDDDHHQIANGMGMALRHPVVVLSCEAISLAAATEGPGGSGGGGLAAASNNYAPEKAGNDVRGDA